MTLNEGRKEKRKLLMLEGIFLKSPFGNHHSENSLNNHQWMLNLIKA